MKVKLIGAGAVGLSVANKLLNHSELSLIVDDERKARYSCGLKYNGKIIDIPFASDSRTDLLIVAVKNFHLESSLDLIGRYVSEDTVILPLLNGIDSERVLSRTFGSKKSCMALSRICRQTIKVLRQFVSLMVEPLSLERGTIECLKG